MKEKEIKISFREYSSLEDLSAVDRVLAEAAVRAQKTSYAPYSRFNVGAAVLLSDGTVVTGSNQENAATPSGLCAERVALFSANANYPGVPMEAIAIAGGPEMTICDTPATPCGACRQVMAQYQAHSRRPMTVLMVGAKQIWKFSRVDDILPFIFDSWGQE